MDGGRTSAVSVGITEGREGRLERDFEEFCEDAYADSGGQSCSEILSPPE